MVVVVVCVCVWGGSKLVFRTMHSTRSLARVLVLSPLSLSPSRGSDEKEVKTTQKEKCSNSSPRKAEVCVSAGRLRMNRNAPCAYREHSSFQVCRTCAPDGTSS